MSWHGTALGACLHLGLDDETIRCDLSGNFPLIEPINLGLFLNGPDFEVRVIPKSRYPAPAGTRGASLAHPMPRASTFLSNGSPCLPNSKDPPKSPLVLYSSPSSPLVTSSSPSSLLVPSISALPECPLESTLPERPLESALPEHPQVSALPERPLVFTLHKCPQVSAPHERPQMLWTSGNPGSAMAARDP